MEKYVFTTLDEMFRFMREKVSEICKHYQTDLAIDVQSICEDFYTKSKSTHYIWEVGECGTHLIHSENTEHLEAVKANYPSGIYFDIRLA